MRQAGRYLPEYREIRKTRSLAEICETPELACEAAMQPIRRFDLDAAILFSDLLVPVRALGAEFEIVEGRGPVVARPIRDRDAVRSLKPPSDPRSLDFAFEAVRLLAGALAASGRRVPVIGFAGAPFTIASYLIEGGATRDFLQTRSLMHHDPVAFADLMQRLSDLVIQYVEGQVRAGAQAIQIFDSWAGCLSPSDYKRHVLEPTRRIFAAGGRMGVPMIHFGTTTSGLLELMAFCGGDVQSVDWRIPLSAARARCPGRAVQGNLDPAALLAPQPVLERMIDEVLAEAGSEPGHIFNLGHGVLPGTPVDNVALLIRSVREKSRRPVSETERQS